MSTQTESFDVLELSYPERQLIVVLDDAVVLETPPAQFMRNWFAAQQMKDATV